MHLYFDESGDFAFPADCYDVYVQAGLIVPDSFVGKVELYVANKKDELGVKELHAAELPDDELVAICEWLSSGPLSLLEFRRVAGGTGGGVPTLDLTAITPLSGPATPTRTFSFDGMSKINGKLFDHNRIDFEVPYNVTERWRFVTNGNAPHPVHVHGASFQVQSRKGGRNQIFPWERGWKDTVLLEDRETVEVLIRFDALVNRGSRYLIHCHKLEHEDMGMMSAFKVV